MALHGQSSYPRYPPTAVPAIVAAPPLAENSRLTLGLWPHGEGHTSVVAAINLMLFFGHVGLIAGLVMTALIAEHGSRTRQAR